MSDDQNELVEAAGISNPYQLKRPVKTIFKGPSGDREEVLSEVSIRRPTAADLLIIDQLQARPIALMLEMVIRLSGLSRKIVERIDAEDIDPLGKLALANVGDGPPTGEIA